MWQITGCPRDLFNLYLVDDVLVDAGTRWASGRIWSLVRTHGVKMVVLTHCHPDHQGAAAYVCDRLKIPLVCHAAEVPVMEGKVRMEPDGLIVRLGQFFWAGPPWHVERTIKEGDEVAGFRVVETPGHTAGHISLYREKDGVVIAGDTIANIHFFNLKPGLRIPPPYFCVNAGANRLSALRLLELDPQTVCFGHGPVSRDRPTLRRFADRLRRAVAGKLQLAEDWVP